MVNLEVGSPTADESNQVVPLDRCPGLLVNFNINVLRYDVTNSRYLESAAEEDS